MAGRGNNGYFIEAGKHQNHLLKNFDKIWVPSGREREEVEQLAHKAFQRFYIRPKTVWTWIKNAPHMPFLRIARMIWGGLYYFLFSPLYSEVRRYRGRGSRYA